MSGIFGTYVSIFDSRSRFVRDSGKELMVCGLGEAIESEECLAVKDFQSATKGCV